MPLTPEDVQNKRFSTVRFKEGYDEEEVDAFLDEVEAELRRLLSENGSLQSRIAAAPAPTPTPTPTPAPAPSAPAEEPSEAALRTLLLAQRTADEAIAQAKHEAEQIVAQAKSRSANIEAEAQQQHQAAMAQLQQQRSALEAQVEDLRAFEREYRTRMKAYLENQLRDLDSRGAGGPASSGRPAGQTPPATGAPQGAAGRGAAPTGGPASTPATPPQSGSTPSGGAGSGPAGQPQATARPGQPEQPSSPFTQVPRLVEDVDADSDAPTGPPREPDGDTDAS